ncbi:MAG: nuclear transport factor 2 family protein [Gallionella sp.]
MVSKFNTSGLMIMAAAGLAIGLAKPALQTDKSFDTFSSDVDRGMFIQSRQVNDDQISDKYTVAIDPAAKQQLGERTFNEVTRFFQTVEEAIEAENTHALMAHYSDNYRDGALDKKSVEQAWRRIFARVDAAATVNNLTLVNISADGNTVVLQSSGLLVGVPDGERWPATIDNWNKQDHVLVKQAGEWKLIGIYGPERQRLWFDKPTHSLI